MKSPRHLNHGSANILAAALLIASLSGCASPGPARPPSLHLPRVVTDLTAVRTGDNVLLRWTTPEKTTDGLKVSPTLTAEICRQTAASTCTPATRLAVHPGASEATEALPGNLATGPATLLTYRIRILNAKGHSAGLSAPAFTAAGAAPPPIEHLHATPVREGAMLEWQPQPTPAFIELRRTLVQTKPVPKQTARKPLQLAPSTPTEVRLQAGKPATDPGGTIDPTAQPGEAYRYTAQRVRDVNLDDHSLELRSAPSSPIAVVMHDTFPPKAPTGLVAAPSADSIDLSWEPNTEPDLAGYIVHRQQTNSTEAPTRLTPTPIPAPAFSDRTAQPGQTYTYTVTAIDTAGNESPASNQIQETRRNP